jgi:hypothetical protein
VKRQQPKAKVTRQTREKQIEALAKGKNLIRAHQVARGWPLKSDAAESLVDRWLAIREMEKGDPNFTKQFGTAVMSRLARDTWEVVSRSILSGDADFFKRIAKRIEQEPQGPKCDEMRRAVLGDMIESLSKGEKEKMSKVIAIDLGIKTQRQVDRFRKSLREDK